MILTHERRDELREPNSLVDLARSSALSTSVSASVVDLVEVAVDSDSEELNREEKEVEAEFAAREVG